ncbi:MAG: DUF4827 family protein [Paludibacteraceae bacterium]|nr:DUF4827 family protein [Paludibacteraceae bacterium]
MIKRLIYSSLILAVLCLMMFSCTSSTSYSKELESEENLIKAWLKRNNIKILNEFPEDSLFAEDEMYHFSEGIYFQMLDTGSGEPMQEGDIIILRYKSSTLDENPVVEDYMTTEDRPYPNEIVYGSMTNSCKGWNDAFKLMKRDGSVARIIVPSKLGFNDAIVIPFWYELHIRVLPR